MGYLKKLFFLEGEHWIGLDDMHKLTNDPAAPMKLRIAMEDFNGTKREANYNNFQIADGVSIS